MFFSTIGSILWQTGRIKKGVIVKWRRRAAFLCQLSNLFERLSANKSQVVKDNTFRVFCCPETYKMVA